MKFLNKDYGQQFRTSDERRLDRLQNVHLAGVMLFCIGIGAFFGVVLS